MNEGSGGYLVEQGKILLSDSSVLSVKLKTTRLGIWGESREHYKVFIFCVVLSCVLVLAQCSH